MGRPGTATGASRKERAEAPGTARGGTSDSIRKVGLYHDYVTEWIAAVVPPIFNRGEKMVYYPGFNVTIGDDHTNGSHFSNSKPNGEGLEMRTEFVTS